MLLYGFRSSKAEFSDKLYASELEGIFDYLREQYHPGCRTVCAESYKELEEGCCDDCEVGEWRSGIRMKTSYVQDLLVGERRLLEEIVCGGAGEVLVCGEGSEMARNWRGYSTTCVSSTILGVGRCALKATRSLRRGAVTIAR